MQALALRILRWLGARNSRELASLTVRDIHRSRGPGTTSSQVRVALRLLEDHGYVRVERLSAGRGGGRPSERVLVSPQIQNHGTSSDSGARTSVLSPTSDDSGDFRFRPRDARGIPIRPSGSLVTASGAAARATRRTGTANRSRSAADEPHLQGLRQTFLSRLTEVPDKAEMNGVALDLGLVVPDASLELLVEAVTDRVLQRPDVDHGTVLAGRAPQHAAGRTDRTVHRKRGSKTNREEVAANMSGPNPFLSVPEVAERLRCSRRTIHELTRGRKDPTPKAPRKTTLPIPTRRTRGLGERRATSRDRTPTRRPHRRPP